VFEMDQILILQEVFEAEPRLGYKRSGWWVRADLVVVARSVFRPLRKGEGRRVWLDWVE